MKINITNRIKSFLKRKGKEIWDRSDAGHIFLSCIVAILSTYIIIINFPSMSNEEEGSCCVEVTLEKTPLNPTPIKKQLDSYAKTKHVQLFNTGVKVNLSAKEFDCLSRNIYWESLREPLIGQIAVANITYNRVKSKKWGDTFCKVIFQPKQFSWTNIEKIRNAKPKNEMQWRRAKHSALLFSRGVRVTMLEKAHFYYADYIKPPKWSSKMNKTAKIGTHIFFAEK